MTEATASDSRQMLDLLIQQRDLYRQLGQLTDKQRGAIDSQLPEDLLRILGDRQRLINQLTEINEQLEPFRGQWDQIRRTIPAVRRQRISQLVDEVGELLSEILKQDASDCDLLEQRTSECQGDAMTASVGQKINAAYAVECYTQPQPRFVDCSDEETNKK